LLFNDCLFKQSFYNQIEVIKQKISEKDKQIYELSTYLRRIDRNLQHLIDTSKENIESIKTSMINRPSVEDIVVLSQRTSGTMGESPFDWTQGESMFFRPPFPDQTLIQKTYLYTGDELQTKREKQPEIINFTVEAPQWMKGINSPPPFHPEESENVKKEEDGGLFDDLLNSDDE